MSGEGGKNIPVVADSPEQVLRDAIAMERSQARRIIAWFVTFFVFVSLLSLALMLMAGLTVLRQVREVLDTVGELHEHVAISSMQVGGMTNRFADVERAQLNIISRINAVQTAQEQELERLVADIRRHGRWIESREQADERDKRHLNERLLTLGEDTARTAAALEQTRRRLDEFLAIDGVVVVAGERAAIAPDPKPATDVDAGPMPAVLNTDVAYAIEDIFNALLKEVAAPVRDRSVPTTVSVVSFPNGDRYEGEFRNGLMHGWGLYITRLGDRFEGMFENDVRHGPGTLTTTSGERFTGTYVNGVRQGLGSLTRADGSRFAGNFRNDLINGRGVMFYPDGSKYVGDFMNGRRHGHGVMRFPNGDIYEGEFRNEQRTGQGTYLFADGSRYAGSFVDGVRHGMGRYLFVDGAEYIGPFKDGRMHGEGVRVYADGQRVKGLWRDGEHLRDIRD